MFADKTVKAFFTTNKDGNIAYHVIDKKQYKDVENNRINLEKTYGIDVSRLKYMDQIHGNDVKIVDEDFNLYEKCDGLITNKKNTPLMVMSADCIGILFFDNVKQVIAVAHAGRNGTFLNISSKVISSMVENFNTNPKDIEVILGPSIGMCCYEVSVEMAQIVEQSFGKEFTNGRYIDLQGINKMQLLQMGLDEKNIFISEICTKCKGKEYFSYRNDKSCGRFAGIVSLL